MPRVGSVVLEAAARPLTPLGYNWGEQKAKINKSANTNTRKQKEQIRESKLRTHTHEKTGNASAKNTLVAIFSLSLWIEPPTPAQIILMPVGYEAVI